jgi:peptidase M1-like protein
VLARPAAVVVLLAFAAAAGPSQPPAAAPAPSAQTAAPEPILSPRNASYAITARLDPASRTIRGDEILTWRNTAATSATTLQFHLYYNAWRNTRSTWMRERRLGRSDPARVRRPPEDWGWIDVTSVRVIGGGAPSDLTSRMRFIAPDDGNPDDRTVLEVPLERAVAPGETINVQIAWSSHVPRTFARTGAIGDFYFIAQWFPKIGVLQDTGWNCHQFHSATEFFADFGVYDVRLTVPKGWIVGATGVERDTRDEADGTTTHHYYQADVHDFAWTTSPDYIEKRARFEHPALPAVEMRLLLQPEHEGQAERHFEATRAALKYYGEWFGAYPYGHVTIVDPAWQSQAGGMEYPTLFTAGTRWLTPSGVTVPEGVTVHEAGHQFWFGIVASNEFEDAWMDEGLNTFSTARVIEQAYTPNYYSKRYFGDFIPWVFRDVPLSRATDGDRLGAFRPVATSDAQATPTWRYWPGSASAITYDKTALWLHTLERMLGWDTLQRIMSTYYSRYAFKHPRPSDFFAVANEVSGRDLTWFFDQVYRGSNAFDYGVDAFTSEPATVRGYVGDADRRTLATPDEPAGSYHTTLAVRRYGEGVFPVDVRVVFDNKEEVRWHWDGKDRWKLFEIDKPSRAAFAEVDPDHVLLLDLRYTNNSATLAPRAHEAARKWSLAWLVWLQDQLMTYGFFI